MLGRGSEMVWEEAGVVDSRRNKTCQGAIQLARTRVRGFRQICTSMSAGNGRRHGSPSGSRAADGGGSSRKAGPDGRAGGLPLP